MRQKDSSTCVEPSLPLSSRTGTECSPRTFSSAMIDSTVSEPLPANLSEQRLIRKWVSNSSARQNSSQMSPSRSQM